MTETKHVPALRIVLLRGLPSSGKSWTSRRIAAEGDGRVVELTPAAGATPAGRRTYLAEVKRAVDEGTPLIVVDGDHRRGLVSRAIAGYAALHGYALELAEPESPWWREIRELLEDKRANGAVLARWAEKLALLSRARDAVSAEDVLRSMDAWEGDLSPVDLLAFGAGPADEDARAEVAA